MPRFAPRGREGALWLRRQACPGTWGGLHARSRARAGPWGWMSLSQAPTFWPGGDPGPVDSLGSGPRSPSPGPRGRFLGHELSTEVTACTSRLSISSLARPSARKEAKGARLERGPLRGAQLSRSSGPRVGAPRGPARRGFVNEPQSASQLTDQRAAVTPPTWSSEPLQ